MLKTLGHLFTECSFHKVNKSECVQFFIFSCVSLLSQNKQLPNRTCKTIKSLLSDNNSRTRIFLLQYNDIVLTEENHIISMILTHYGQYRAMLKGIKRELLFNQASLDNNCRRVYVNQLTRYLVFSVALID